MCSQLFQNLYLECSIGSQKLSFCSSAGFFGEVFRGIWNGTDVAIKVLLELDLTAETMEDFCNEISILRYLTQYVRYSSSLIMRVLVSYSLFLSASYPSQAAFDIQMVTTLSIVF